MKIIFDDFRGFQIVIWAISELSKYAVASAHFIGLSWEPDPNQSLSFHSPLPPPHTPLQSNLHIARMIFSKHKVNNLFYHFETLPWLFIVFVKSKHLPVKLHVLWPGPSLSHRPHFLVLSTPSLLATLASLPAKSQLLL